MFQALTSPGVSLAGTAVPRFVSAIAAMTEPVALVLDHVELLDNPECLDVVAELALGLPEGHSWRSPPGAPRGCRWRCCAPRARSWEVGVDELAMDVGEARALLDATGVALSDAEMTELAGQTEGWPVGLYLAALALKAGVRRGGPGWRSAATTGSSPTTCTPSSWPTSRPSW